LGFKFCIHTQYISYPSYNALDAVKRSVLSSGRFAPWEESSESIEQKAWWAPVLVWTCWKRYAMNIYE
jgi:hypothetical protein